MRNYCPRTTPTAGSVVMIVQCGTTTNVKHDVWWKSIPRIVVARFSLRVLREKKRPMWAGKAEVFIRSRGTARSAVASLWSAYKTITNSWAGSLGVLADSSRHSNTCHVSPWAIGLTCRMLHEGAETVTFLMQLITIPAHDAWESLPLSIWSII